MEDILREVQNEILFVSVSHEMVNRFKFETIKRSIKKGVKITVRILNPNSEHVSKKQRLFGQTVDDLHATLDAKLSRLCDQKRKLKKLGIDLSIETYDDRLTRCCTLLDPQSENPWTRVEKHVPRIPVSGNPEVHICEIIRYFTPEI
jgi:hypothetical protein